MKLYNRSEEMRSAVRKFEFLSGQLGSDEGFIEVDYNEYSLLLEHYNVKPPRFWQRWPKINGITIIRQGFAK